MLLREKKNIDKSKIYRDTGRMDDKGAKYT